MKELFELRPALRRYKSIWDLNIAFNYCSPRTQLKGTHIKADISSEPPKRTEMSDNQILKRWQHAADNWQKQLLVSSSVLW